MYYPVEDGYDKLLLLVVVVFGIVKPVLYWSHNRDRCYVIMLKIIDFLGSSYMMCNLQCLRAVTMKVGVLWDVTPYSVVER